MGKTTLMRSIMGLTPPRSGSIMFAGARFLDFWPLSLFSSGDRAYLRLLLVGIALIALVIWRPQGIFGNRREDALET